MCSDDIISPLCYIFPPSFLPSLLDLLFSFLLKETSHFLLPNPTITSLCFSPALNPKFINYSSARDI